MFDVSFKLLLCSQSCNCSQCLEYFLAIDLQARKVAFPRPPAPERPAPLLYFSDLSWQLRFSTTLTSMPRNLDYLLVDSRTEVWKCG